MKLNYFKFRVYSLLFLLIGTGLLFSQDKETKTPTTIAELQSAIEAILKETKTPAVGLTLVNKDGVVWTKTLGKADVENNISADENTMFRIASISKMFVSLAILKLQEEGLVNLKDKVSDLVPDVEFKNPWEKTSPILVENLLEHTTGWEDYHLVESAKDGSKLTLKEAIDFHPHSRVSRWMPGTRFSYSNSGTGVAAYVVEKITGQKFEDYIQNTFFNPMGMTSMTYYIDTKAYKQHGAKLYMDGKPAKMWNALHSPSASINATPADMAKMVSFFIHRAKIDSVQLLSEASLKRMETPSSSIGAQAGLEDGYGLSNYSSTYKSVVYREHNGSALGGLSYLSYLPEYNLGYAVMTNSSNVEAIKEITNLIRAYQLKDIEFNNLNSIKLTPNNETDLSGYYMSINPRFERFNSFERFFNAQRMIFIKDTLLLSPVFGEEDPERFIQINPTQFASPETHKITMVKIDDPLAGTVFYNKKHVLKPIPAVLLFGQVFILGFWILGMFTAILFSIVWSIRFWMGKMAGGPNIWIRLWPLIATVCCLIAIITLDIGSTSGDFYGTFGNITLMSITVFVFLIVFALASLWSVYYLFKVEKGRIKKLTYWYSAALICLNFLATCYFLWWGLIGVPTWN